MEFSRDVHQLVFRDATHNLGMTGARYHHIDYRGGYHGQMTFYYYKFLPSGEKELVEVTLEGNAAKRQLQIVGKHNQLHNLPGQNLEASNDSLHPVLKGSAVDHPKVS